MTAKKKLMIFAEDPGAINYIIDLQKELRKSSFDVHILASGYAINLLEKNKLDFIIIGSESVLLSKIETIKPDLILVGTSQNLNSYGLSLIDISKAKGIQTVGFVDMEVDARFRFSGTNNSPLRYAPDYLIVPDESTKIVFSELGYTQRNIFICGNPNFDRILLRKEHLKKNHNKNEKEKLFPDSGNRKVVTFISEHLNNNDPRMFFNDDYTLNGRGLTKNRTGIVLEEVLDVINEISPRPFFILRLHPKNNISEFEKYSDEIDLFSKEDDPIPIIWYSDLIIGMSSMLVMESILLEKSVISILPRIIEKEWAPHTKYEFIPCLYYRDDIRRIINNFLQYNLPLDTKNKLTLKENSIKNILNILNKILYNETPVEN